MRRLLLGLALVAWSASAAAQVKNPTAVEFSCPDHAQDTGHEIDIIRAADGVVIQTIQGGDPAEAGGIVRISLNVQPVAFGDYRIVVRAVAGTVLSENSELSDLWQRVPGSPSKPTVK